LDAAKAANEAAETYAAPKKPVGKKSLAAKTAVKAPAKSPAKAAPAKKPGTVAKEVAPKKPAANLADPKSGKTT
jgi:DNA-binding protein HU-beta